MNETPRAGGSEGAIVRWRLRLAYDGSTFRGFAAQHGQPAVRTVAGSLAAALERVTRAPVVLTCAGRTDAGVHAVDQVVHFDLPAERSAGLEPDRVLRSCNRQLAPSIVVREVGIAPAGFDARRSATARRYRYLILNAPVADPLLAGTTWHVPEALDLRSMAAGADAILGEHDFRAFCRRVPGTSAEEPIPRRVTDVRWSTDQGVFTPGDGRILVFEIEANAFCHQMVRSLVGTLVDVGRARKRPADLVWILRSTDRALASQPAPPGGLTLVSVTYPRWRNQPDDVGNDDRLADGGVQAVS